MGSLILPSSGPVYADALIFIYSVEKHPIYALTLRPLWEAVARGDLEVLSSGSPPPSRNAIIRTASMFIIASRGQVSERSLNPPRLMIPVTQELKTTWRPV